MKLRLALLGIIAAALATIFTLVTNTSDVRTDDVGGCVVYINGVDVRSHNTPSNALEVDVNDVVDIYVVAPAPLASYKIEVACTDLLNWTISEETIDGKQTSYRTTIEVADYADYGVGLYKVTATGVLEKGDTCSTVAFINVTGKSVLSTVAGASALGLAVSGTFGLLLLTLLVWLGTKGSRCTFSFLLLSIPLTSAITTAVMVKNGAEKPSSEDSQTTGVESIPQATAGSQDTPGGSRKFCLKISLLGIGCALLAAIGYDLLFQQTSLAYPTLKVVLFSLLLAPINAIVMQSFAATFSRR